MNETLGLWIVTIGRCLSVPDRLGSGGGSAAVGGSKHGEQRHREILHFEHQLLELAVLQQGLDVAFDDGKSNIPERRIHRVSVGVDLTDLRHEVVQVVRVSPREQDAAIISMVRDPIRWGAYSLRLVIIDPRSDDMVMLVYLLCSSVDSCKCRITPGLS